MLFNSYIFVLLFLPLCILGYFGLNGLGRYKLAQVYLLGMSFWFYGYASPQYLLVIIASIAANFSFYCALNRFSLTNNVKVRKFILGTALLFNIGVLFYFKYTDFFIDTVNGLFRTSYNTLNIVTAGNQFFYVPADFFYCGYLPWRSA